MRPGSLTAFPPPPLTPTHSVKPDPSTFGRPPYTPRLGGRLPLRETPTWCDCDFCLAPEDKRFNFFVGGRNNAASTATTTTECVAATSSIRPVPRWLPHIVPPRLQPLVPHELVYLSLTVSCTHPHPSHEPRLPSQPTRCCSHPIPGSHSRPPHAAASITATVLNRPPITALNPLRPFAPAFVCWCSLTTAYGAPTVSTGRHPKTPLSAVYYFFGLLATLCLPNYDSRRHL